MQEKKLLFLKYAWNLHLGLALVHVFLNARVHRSTLQRGAVAAVGDPHRKRLPVQATKWHLQTRQLCCVAAMRQHLVPEVMQHAFDMQVTVAEAQFCSLGSPSFTSFSTTWSIAALCSVVLWLP